MHALWSLPYSQGHSSHHGVPSSRPQLTLITSLKSHLLIPSNWELTFQHMNFRDSQTFSLEQRPLQAKIIASHSGEWNVNLGRTSGGPKWMNVSNTQKSKMSWKTRLSRGNRHQKNVRVPLPLKWIPESPGRKGSSPSTHLLLAAACQAWRWK